MFYDIKLTIAKIRFGHNQIQLTIMHSKTSCNKYTQQDHIKEAVLINLSTHIYTHTSI